MSRCEGLSGQVRNSVTELVVTRSDKATPLAVEGMAYGEIGIESFAEFGGVWGI